MTEKEILNLINPEYLSTTTEWDKVKCTYKYLSTLASNLNIRDSYVNENTGEFILDEDDVEDFFEIGFKNLKREMRTIDGIRFEFDPQSRKLTFKRE